MVEPIYPVAIVPRDGADLTDLRDALWSVGPVWPCMRAAELDPLVTERRVRLVIATPRDADGAPMADVLQAVAARHSAIKMALVYRPTPYELLDARAVAVTGACVAYLIQPVANFGAAARAILSLRWRRGPERTLARGLLGPLIRTAEPFAILSVLHPRAAAGVRDICGLCGLRERQVERDFSLSFPRAAPGLRVTPLRFCRLALALTVVWWLAHGYRVPDLVHHFGFAHRYALAALVTRYAGRSPGSVSRPMHFREVYVGVVRRLRGL